MSERRYDEDEAARIFAAASEASPEEPEAGTARSSGSGGLTLGELREIAQQAGIDPEQVSAAARALDRRALETRALDRTPLEPRRTLGFTVGVNEVARPKRRIDDAEWERLVVLLRDTFDARGRVLVQGNLRQWTNGNLHIFVEPTADGDRVRMRTTNANARALFGVGIAALATGAFVALMGLRAAGGIDLGLLGGAGLLGAAGATAFGAALARLRRWVPLRREQFGRIAERLESGPLE